MVPDHRSFIRLGAVIGVLYGANLFAQTTDSAVLQGRVVDQVKLPVSGALITVVSSLSSLQRTAQSDADGGFTIAGLPLAASFNLVAKKDGFTDGKLNGLVLQSGEAASVTIQLNVGPGRTQVTVTGIAGEVRTDAPQLANRIVGRQLEETPMLDRRITYLPLLNSASRPAINQGDVFMNQNLFTTNGAGRRQTWFEIDGSTGSDGWGRQTIFTNIPLSAVQEMTVLTSTFSSEYGSSAGGAVNIITRTGGNRLRGQILEVWRPAATEAALSGFTSSNAASGNDFTSNTLSLSDVSLGGPIGASKRMHFFAAGEFTSENRASPVTSPVAPGSYVGHYRGGLGFFRLDYQLSTRSALFFRSGFDGFHDTNPNGTVGGNNLPTVARVFRRRTWSQELGVTTALSSTLLNNVRVQFQLASPITQFDPVVFGTQYQVPISTGGTFTSGTSQSASLVNRQYEASDTLSAIRGRHTFKLGARVIAVHTGGDSKEFGGPIYLGQFMYNTCTQSLSVCESPAYLNNIANVRTYTQSYGSGSYVVNDTQWSLFAQDDFRIRPDLTLNAGVRYERQTFTDFKLGFAPRLGFSYNWRGDGQTVLRGGYGIYYSQVTDNSQANYSLTGPEGVFNYSAAPGQAGFPSSVAAAPLSAFPAGAQVPLQSLYIRPSDSAYLDRFFPTSTLIGYPDRLLNPYTQQWTFGIERKLHPGWVLRADYVGSRTLRINRPLDVDPPAPFVRTSPGQTRSAQAANCTRPYWLWWYGQNGLACNSTTATNPQPPYSVIQSDVNNGYAYYNSLQVNLNGRIGNRLTLTASYTWSHTIDNVDPDVPSQNPNDPNFTGRVENANAIFDQRHRFVLSGVWVGKWGLHYGAIVTLASGLPYNIVTGTTNSGDTGATTDRPVVGGVVIGRNAGRGAGIYDISPLVERPFRVNEHLRIEPRIEVFNLLNHANFVGYSGTWGNGSTPGPGFGLPLAGITNQLPARAIQFAVKITL